MIEVQSIMPNDKETAHVVASKIISTIKDFAESILTQNMRAIQYLCMVARQHQNTNK